LGEGTVSLALHGLSFTATLMVLGIIAREHKIWVRMRDRLNTLWWRHCQTTGDKYDPLENGRG